MIGHKSPPAGPFERHLREAIALNRERAPRYAALSRGASLRISRRLIAVENLLLPVARWFDRQADPYHRAGIPLLEVLFDPMASAPDFEAANVTRSVAVAFPRLRTAPIRRRVWRAYRDNGFAGGATGLTRELLELEAARRSNYLVRHLLESAYRIAVLAPHQVEVAVERGLPSPATLLGRLLRLHLWGLRTAAALDWRAHPLQSQGIAILAQDLPAIVVPDSTKRPKNP